jgi:hypothetical protein
VATLPIAHNTETRITWRCWAALIVADAFAFLAFLATIPAHHAPTRVRRAPVIVADAAASLALLATIPAHHTATGVWWRSWTALIVADATAFLALLATIPAHHAATGVGSTASLAVENASAVLAFETRLTSHKATRIGRRATETRTGTTPTTNTHLAAVPTSSRRPAHRTLTLHLSKQPREKRDRQQNAEEKVGVFHFRISLMDCRDRDVFKQPTQMKLKIRRVEFGLEGLISG